MAELLSKRFLSADETAFVQRSKCGASPDGKTLVCCAASANPALPLPPKCGQDLSDRIHGGQPTDVDEFPWTALVQYRKPNGQLDFNCGGSLINSRYILTAAHCINAIPKGWSVAGVRLGEYDLRNSAQDCVDGVCADPPVDFGIAKTIVHENYNPNDKDQLNDIALIRLNREVSFTAYIKPICLPVADDIRNRNIVGTKATAAGWGRTEIAGASPVKLKVNLDITSLSSCSPAYSRLGVTLQDTQLCAGGLEGKDTCSGDSGGPLMRRIGTNYFLFGLVSFGPNKCGTKDVPGVYTSVTKYVDWVQSKLEA